MHVRLIHRGIAHWVEYQTHNLGVVGLGAPVAGKGLVPVKIFTDDIDPGAYDQFAKIAELPVIHSHIAAMPDVHHGIGATVGSVIPTRGAIEVTVPVGFYRHKSIKARRSTLTALDAGLEQILHQHPTVGKLAENISRTGSQQVGALGGGNHFIELCLDENDDVWVMLHSGSRGIGNVIERYFIGLAKKDMQRLQQDLPDKDLAYFTESTKYFGEHVHAVQWGQDYVMANRREMMRLTLDALTSELPQFLITKEAINCHHNYVSIEDPKKLTQGVNCRNDARVVDEIAVAYQDIDKVMASQSDLACSRAWRMREEMDGLDVVTSENSKKAFRDLHGINERLNHYKKTTIPWNHRVHTAFTSASLPLWNCLEWNFGCPTSLIN